MRSPHMRDLSGLEKRHLHHLTGTAAPLNQPAEKITSRERKVNLAGNWPCPEHAGGSSTLDTVSGTNSDLKSLLWFLNDRTGVPVVAETRLNEKYTYDLKAVEKDYESLRKAVREQLGFDLREERRKLPVVVVRKAGSAQG